MRGSLEMEGFTAEVAEGRGGDGHEKHEEAQKRNKEIRTLFLCLFVFFAAIPKLEV